MGHNRGRLAYRGRLKSYRKLEAGQLPVVVSGHEDILWVQISVDELADGMQVVERLEDLLGGSGTEII